MKKTLLLLLAFTGTLLATAQNKETKKKTDWSKIDLTDRPAAVSYTHLTLPTILRV